MRRDDINRIMEKKEKKNALEKIVVSIGVGKFTERSDFKDKILPEIQREVAIITGQWPALRQAKKAIANFKTRVGDPIGLQVTLRGKRMRDFFVRLNRVVLPRVKDFRGLEIKNVDHGGSLNIGFREQYVFPEIDADRATISFGLQVTIVPVIKDRARAIDFYREEGVPLRK